MLVLASAVGVAATGTVAPAETRDRRDRQGVAPDAEAIGRTEADEGADGPERTRDEQAEPATSDASATHLHTHAQYGYDLLDPTTNINRKQLLVLRRKRDGVLAPDRLHLQGAITAIGNLQFSNRADKFGYLMRHPTSANQVGSTVSEAAVHSLQLGLTGTLGSWVTANTEILYDPEQSFGTGTNTALARNQLQVRRAYVLLGDLDRSPLYLSVGKMAVPFGLTDTVNPFTASTVWHAFGGLANGVTVGYLRGGLHVAFMGIQGGAQFRAANVPVEGTAVPSRLNNLAADVNYSLPLTSSGSVLVGGSYQRGTAYCQDFPVIHFAACRDNNPAYDTYGRLVYGRVTLKGEIARTTREWPGTFNPAMPAFAASVVTSFDIGVRYRLRPTDRAAYLSAEFSRFEAGPQGAPWEHQDQWVLGLAWFPRGNGKLFAEYVRVAGYAPLNFISGGSVLDAGGNVIPGRTHSDRSARSNVFVFGVNVAF